MQFVSMEHFSLLFSFLLREFDDWNASDCDAVCWTWKGRVIVTVKSMPWVYYSWRVSGVFSQ